MKKILLTLCAVLSLTLPIIRASEQSYMQPLKKDGLYYYSEADLGKKFDLTGALSFLATRLAPSAIIKKVASLFYKEEKSDPIKLLNPTTTKPANSSIEPKITWIGHATFLIQINGFNIITDPIFGDVKVGPFTLTKRGMPAGVKLEDLPPIDAIVISHNHSDHMDTNALMALCTKHNPTIYVPEGNTETVAAMGFNKIVGNNWWDSNILNKKDGTNTDRSVKITCVPANHWSIRFDPRSYRKSLWCGWMISTQDTNIFFAGDTADGAHFKQIAQKFPPIDLALMPIGPTEEGENKHKNVHVDAPAAVDAFIDLNARCFVPMHYATFFLSKDTLEHPIKRLNAYWQEKQEQLVGKKLFFARCGETFAVE